MFSRFALLALALSIPLGCGQGVVVDADGQGGGGAEGTGDGGSRPCAEDSPCPAGQYCNYTYLNACGRGPGSCETPDPSCADGGEPVCGCDGKLYLSRCGAQAALVDVGDASRCTLPPGQFPCGPDICEEGEYCESTYDEAFICLPLPSGCQASDTCEACFPDGPPGFECRCDENYSGTGIRVYCT